MKNWIKNILILIIITSIFELQAQTNSIAPLFAIGENSTAIQALNQINGDNVLIDGDFNFAAFDKNYTYSPENNTAYFIAPNPLDAAQSILYTLLLPEFHTESLIVLNDTLPVAIDAITYHSSDRLYLNTANEQQYYYMDLIQNQLIGPLAFFPQQIEPTTIVSVADSNSLYIGGVALGNPTTINLTKIDTGTSATTPVEYVGYQSLAIVEFSATSILAIIEDFTNVFYSALIDDQLTLQILDTLPSCIDCSNESYTYPQNGLTYDFDNNTVLTIVEKTVGVTTTQSLLTIDASNGSVVQELSLNDNYRNLMYMRVNENIVFPGDANHDGVVDMKDALAIGLQHVTPTYTRTTPVLQWLGQSSINLNNPFVNNSDIKHADCNGDGQINVLDTLSILNNFKSIHNAGTNLPANMGDCAVPISFSLKDNTIHDDKITLSVILGSDDILAEDVYGIAFTIVYDTAFIKNNTVSTQGIDSWFGFYEQDHFKLAKDDYNNGELTMAVVGVDHQGRSGSGGIIKSIWGIEGEVIPIAQPVDIDFSIRDVYLIDYEENVKEVCNMDTTFTITRKSVGVKDLDNTFFNIYPQPSHDVVKIDCEEEISTATIISMSGAVLREYNDVQNEININGLSAGIYLIKVTTKNSVGVQKLLVN